jgi:riboflavin kinase/FMN adenylyltransferase
MELIRGYYNLRPEHRGCAATIGNFDGVHVGHQAIFQVLRDRAHELGAPSVAIVFEPQPAEYFAPDSAPARLTRLREKLSALDQAGVDWVQCLRFDRSLAALSPNAFIRHVLVDGLGVRYLAVGDDFRFGAGRRGDFSTLRDAGRRHGFTVEDTPTVRLNGERVSSTRIREALAAGELDHARGLLGRPYSICGRVVQGQRLGRTLGFPTANIALRRRTSPLQGVFAVTVQGAGLADAPGVANIGRRPTVGGDRLQLEVNLLAFQGDLYGRYLEVRFHQRIRPERRFDSLDALRAQIERDAAAARAWLANRSTSDGMTVASR